MFARTKSLGLLLAVTSAALLPLYGDPRPSPVTHPEWARMLLRALGMDTEVDRAQQASQVFSTLSWKNSLFFAADRYLRAEGVQIERSAAHRVVATDRVGEVAYGLSVVRPGDYRVRLRVAGDPKSPAAAEISAAGKTVPLKTFTVLPATVTSWIEAGTTHLDPGTYMASVLLPQGCSLDALEVSPPCLSAIEPLGGWQAAAILQATDLAVTAIKALDMESELPPAVAAIELSGSAFQTAGSPTFASAPRDEGLTGLWLRAGPRGTLATVFVDLPEAGLYTVRAFGIQGAGQRWLADSCRKAVLCGGSSDAEGPQWKTLMTAAFTPGHHFFTVSLGRGAAIERLRLERKKDSPADYAATLRRLGFDPGPDGPVSRSKAVDAMKFIASKRTEVAAGSCGDMDPVSNPETRVADGSGAGAAPLAEPAGPVAGPGAEPRDTGAGPPPLAPPVLPPQQPASPVIP